MSTLASSASLPPLQDGERLDQKMFHERYEAMGDDVKAELIGGVVHIASPVKRPRGRVRALVSYWLTHCMGQTPGTEVLDNASTILGDESEPQPDNALLVLPECGGQVHEDAKGVRVRRARDDG
jgi:hypothetical protein